MIKAAFLTPLVLSGAKDVYFTLVSPLVFQCIWDPEKLQSRLYRKGDVVRIVVKPGLLTDFASVPRLFWFLFPPHKRTWRKPAVLHDALYQFAPFNRLTADRIFYYALRLQGLSKWKAKMFYKAVRVGGRKPYIRYAKRRIEGSPPLPDYSDKKSLVEVKLEEKGWITYFV